MCEVHNRGDSLFLVAKRKIWSKNPEPILPLTKLPLDTKIDLDYEGNTIWWAIPSVVADPSYPFRISADPMGPSQAPRKGKER
jgi:hypothetical protein